MSNEANLNERCGDIVEAILGEPIWRRAARDDSSLTVWSAAHWTEEDSLRFQFDLRMSVPE
jgi:hypothetical protein